MNTEHDDDLSLYVEVVEKCASSRLYFVENVLGVEHVEDWQREALEYMDGGGSRLSVRSGHGVGKTALCAWLALHYVLFRNDVKVVVTAPASSQMKDGLIPETKLWARRLPDVFRQQIDWTEDRVFRVEDRDNNFISFRTARQDAPEALAGIHAKHVLVIVDEASGVPDIVYENAQGTMSTEGAVFVLIGNPTRPKGYFYKTQTSKSTRWRRMHVSCFDSSRVDYNFIEEVKDQFGVDSKPYQVRVLGEFPTGNHDSLIPRELAESALGRDVEPIAGEALWGVDPGRGGDPTGFCIRRENVIEALEEWHTGDLMAVVGYVHQLWKDTAERERPSAIYVDSIGIGAGVADRLRELGLPAIDINVSESPALKNVYTKLRAELWYSAKFYFEQRNVLIPSSVALGSRLVDELVEPEAKYTSLGKNDVESKREMKARGIKSPNLADALCMTFAGDVSLASGRAASQSSGRRAWNKPLDVSAVHVV